MLTSLLLITVGFVALYYGAEWLVRGATRIAANLEISKVVVGIVLVAFGTSSPELFVNLIAAYKGRTGFVLSNVAGSNLTNLCIGFGVSGFLVNLVVDKKKFWIDLVYFSVGPLFVLLLMALVKGLPLWSTGLLLVIFATYFIFIKGRLRSQEEAGQKGKLFGGFFLFFLGCGILYGGGELIVRSAVSIGKLWGISDTILGLTIVAFGTSVPDVMASVVAARRGENSIAVGNLLGSNIFNVLFVLSGTLLVSWQGLLVDQKTLLDYAVVSISSLAFFGWVLFSQRISRISGSILILAYILYMLYRVLSDVSF